MEMIDRRLYYWASQLVVVNDWMYGGWSNSTYVRELQPLGLNGVLGMMYSCLIAESLPDVTQVVLLAWRGALHWTGWDRRLTL